MTDSLADLIVVLRNTIEIVREQTAHEKLGVVLESVDIELSVETTSKDGVDVSVKYGVSAGAGMTRSTGSTDRIKLTLTPSAPLELGFKPVASDRLATAIVQMARDAKSLPAKLEGKFKVQEFEVGLEIALAREGGLHFVWVSERTGTGTHNLTLRFRPS